VIGFCRCLTHDALSFTQQFLGIMDVLWHGRPHLFYEV
jgi:hypothetical protein